MNEKIKQANSLFVSCSSRQDALFGVKPAPLPYDEALLEKSRTQWQFGDWRALMSVDTDALSNHPEKQKIALLVASAHFQEGEIAEAQRLVRFARDYGISLHHIAEVMIAGVHNTLARTYLLVCHSDRARFHFTNAVQVGSPGSDYALISNARMVTQLEQLSVNEASNKTQNSVGVSFVPFQRLLMNNLQEESRLETIESHLATQDVQLNKFRKLLQTTIRNEVLNATKQMEAFFNLQKYFDTGLVAAELHGWAVSADLALYIVQMVESSQYDLIIEFGSGASTQIIAKALSIKESLMPEHCGTIYHAFEHLAKFFQETRRLLTHAGVGNQVNLHHAPLVTYLASDGNQYQYYDCQAVIQDVAGSLKCRTPVILVLVDGPPGRTCHHARYPALPILLDFFPDSRIDFILDDYNRPDEREIVEAWVKFLSARGRAFEIVEKKLEKGACKVSVVGSADGDSVVHTSANLKPHF